jgi:predicted secreted protein
MKKITLTLALLIATLTFGSEIDKNEPSKISEKKRIEIVSNANQAIYFWEIKTSNGMASGYTDSEASAKRTIQLLSTNDVVSSKIIETYNK